MIKLMFEDLPIIIFNVLDFIKQGGLHKNRFLLVYILATPSYAQEFLLALAVLGGPDGVPKIKSSLAAYNTSTLLAVLSL